MEQIIYEGELREYEALALVESCKDLGITKISSDGYGGLGSGFHLTEMVYSIDSLEATVKINLWRSKNGRITGYGTKESLSKVERIILSHIHADAWEEK